MMQRILFAVVLFFLVLLCSAGACLAVDNKGGGKGAITQEALRPVANSNFLIPIFVNDLLGYFDLNGDVVVPPRFTGPEYFNKFAKNGLANVKIGDKWGYIDTKGRTAIPATFKSASRFAANGLALVQDAKGLYGFIDAAGRWAVAPQFQKATSFSACNLAAVKKAGKWGYIDSSGKWLVSPQFDEAESFDRIVHYEEASYARKHPFAKVKKNGRWGVLAQNGTWILPPDYSKITSNEDLGLFYVERGEKKEIVTDGGVTIVPPGDGNNQGLGIWYTRNNQKYALLSPDRSAYASKFDDVRDFDSFGFALAPVKQAGLWGFADITGRIVIKPQFDEVRQFTGSGLAAVNKGQRWGYIDTQGEMAIEPQFQSAWDFDRPRGVAAVQREDGLYGFIDKQGNWVIRPQFDSVSSRILGTLSPAGRDGLVGYIDDNGQWGIAPIFDSAEKFTPEGIARVSYKGNAAHIDASGKILLTVDTACGIDVVRNARGEVVWPLDLDAVCKSWESARQSGNVASAASQERRKLTYGKPGSELDECHRMAQPDFWEALSGTELDKAARRVDRIYATCLQSYFTENGYKDKIIPGKYAARHKALGKDIAERMRLGRSAEEAKRDAYSSFLVVFSGYGWEPADSAAVKLVIQNAVKGAAPTNISLSEDGTLLSLFDGDNFVVYEAESKRELWRTSGYRYSLMVNKLALNFTVNPDDGELNNLHIRSAIDGRRLASIYPPEPLFDWLSADNSYASINGVIYDCALAEVVSDRDGEFRRQQQGGKPRLYGSPPRLEPFTLGHSGYGFEGIARVGRFWLFAPAPYDPEHPKNIRLYDALLQKEVPLLVRGRPLHTGDVNRTCAQYGGAYFATQQEAVTSFTSGSTRACYWGVVFSPGGSWLAVTDRQNNIHFFAPKENGRYAGMLSATSLLDGVPVSLYSLKGVIGEDTGALPVCHFVSNSSHETQRLVQADLNTGVLTKYFDLAKGSNASIPSALAVSTDDIAAVSTADGHIFLFDFKTGNLIHRVDNEQAISALAFSNNGGFLGAADRSGQLLIIDRNFKITKLKTDSKNTTHIAVNDSGDTIWLASSSASVEASQSKNTIRHVDGKAGTVTAFTLDSPVVYLRVDDKNNWAEAGVADGSASNNYNLQKPGLRRKQLAEGRLTLVQGDALAVAKQDGQRAFINWKSCDLSLAVQKNGEDNTYFSVVGNTWYPDDMCALALSELAEFSQDSRLIFYQLRDLDDSRYADIYSLELGHELLHFDSQGSPVTRAAFLKHRPLLATINEEGLGLWDLSKGTKARALLRFVFFKNGNYVAVDSSHRFDSPDLNALEGAHWIAKSIPGRTVPLDCFMRDYYQPRLVEYVLSERRLPDLPDISTRNLFQASVAIRKIMPAPGIADHVSVIVEVDARDNGAVQETFDLKLFRDNRLVARHRGNDKDGGLVFKDGKAFVVFDKIALPRGKNRVTFTAYAFNADKVRSKIARVRHAYTPSQSQDPRLRLVAVGVNRFDNHDWDLRYAANDARVFADVLPRHMPFRQRAQTCLLVSDTPSSEAGNTPSRAPGNVPTSTPGASDVSGVQSAKPTKAAIRHILEELGGVHSGTLSHSAEQVAGPDDVVVLCISSHGLTAGDIFYILPADITGSGTAVTPALLKAAISAEELGEWMTTLDARELVLVLDTCESGTALGGEQFKPGPMGDKGLGQIVYDKAARVLCATNGNSAALEVESLGHGILSYVLLREGLEEGKAAGRRGAVVTIRDWLLFGKKRTTELYAAIRGKSATGITRGKLTVDAPPDAAPVIGQTPYFFDLNVESTALRLGQ